LSIAGSAEAGRELHGAFADRAGRFRDLSRGDLSGGESELQVLRVVVPGAEGRAVFTAVAGTGCQLIVRNARDSVSGQDQEAKSSALTSSFLSILSVVCALIQ